MHACAVCAPTVGTGAPLFKVSPWALKLWQRTRRGPPPLHSLSNTPPNRKKYYKSFPGEKQRGNVIWKRGVNPPQQQLLPNHNNLGKGCGLYFMGGEGPRMFIYLSQRQHWGVCACKRVCVCVTRSVIAHFILTQDRARGHQSLCRVPRPVTPRRVTRAHAEYVKIINLVHQNIVMNVWHAENLIELVWCHSLPPPLLSLS